MLQKCDIENNQASILLSAFGDDDEMIPLPFHLDQQNPSPAALKDGNGLLILLQGTVVA